MSDTPFRVVAGLDFSAARDEKRSRAQARARARPVLREWLSRVEHHVRAGKLAPLDLMMATELTNYPSANEGRCYAGQKRLGAAVGKCARSARSSLKRLCQVGLLTSKRGGPGRTASWTFCINGQPIFGTERLRTKRQFSAQDRKEVAGLDRKEVADKPSEHKPHEHKPSVDALNLLRSRLGRHVFTAWFAQVRVEGISDDTVTLSAPTRFYRDYITNNYAHKALDCWKAFQPMIERVEITVR